MTTPAQQFTAFIADGDFRLPYLKSTETAIQIGALDAYVPEDIVWKPASGRGTVSALAIYHRKYDEDFEPPYNVAVVTLREGPFLLSTILDDQITPHIGMPVTAKIDNAGRLVFAPIKEEK